MSNIEEYTEKTFENIKHIDELGNEYWEARELMPLLEYSKWENFHKVIKSTCKKYLKNLDISEISKNINKKDNSDVNNQINDLRKQEKVS